MDRYCVQGQGGMNNGYCIQGPEQGEYWIPVPGIANLNTVKPIGMQNCKKGVMDCTDFCIPKIVRAELTTNFASLRYFCYHADWEYQPGHLDYAYIASPQPQGHVCTVKYRHIPYINSTRVQKGCNLSFLFSNFHVSKIKKQQIL